MLENENIVHELGKTVVRQGECLLLCSYSEEEQGFVEDFDVLSSGMFKSMGMSTSHALVIDLKDGTEARLDFISESISSAGPVLQPVQSLTPSCANSPWTRSRLKAPRPKERSIFLFQAAGWLILLVLCPAAPLACSPFKTQTFWTNSKGHCRKAKSPLNSFGAFSATTGALC